VAARGGLQWPGQGETDSSGSLCGGFVARQVSQATTHQLTTTNQRKEVMSVSPDIVTKNQRNLCVGIAQHANMLQSDMLSAFWTATEDKPIPETFIWQAEEHLKEIARLLVVLRSHQQKLEGAA
jgi:hypothetical protein